MASPTSTRSRRGNAEADTPSSAAETGSGAAAEQQRLHLGRTLIISIMALIAMGISTGVDVGMQERMRLHQPRKPVQERQWRSGGCKKMDLLTPLWNLRRSRRGGGEADATSKTATTGAGTSEQRKLPQERGYTVESAAGQDAAAAADQGPAADRDK